MVKGHTYVPSKHILFCPRCFDIRERIIGLPPDRRHFELSGRDYHHFVTRMCLGTPMYAGVALRIVDETRQSC